MARCRPAGSVGNTIMYMYMYVSQRNCIAGGNAGVQILLLHVRVRFSYRPSRILVQ